MDLLRVSHYLAWNYWNTIGITPKEFVSVISRYFSPPRSRAYFEHTLGASWNDEVFFHTCLTELISQELGSDLVTQLVEELSIPVEFRSLEVERKRFDMKTDMQSLAAKLEKIRPWEKTAHDFHITAKDACDFIFSPNLTNGKIEQEVLNGTKRIDILYQNQAIFGFFNWLNYLRKIECQFIPFECKNYTKDPKNPEIDQLLGRFGNAIGKFWILVLNTIIDRDAFGNKLRENYKDGKWVILFFDKTDLIELLKLKMTGDEEGISNVLLERFKEVTL